MEREAGISFGPPALIVFVLLGLFIILLVFLAGTSGAATIEVPYDYLTIQEAVDNATNGDEVRVQPSYYPGYPGNVHIDKSIALEGITNMWGGNPLDNR